MQEESPEGGRFKKEILVDNQSYLLLIRDEGGPPELQVSLDAQNDYYLSFTKCIHFFETLIQTHYFNNKTLRHDKLK